MEKTTLRDTVLGVLDPERPMRFAEIREALPKAEPNSLSQTLNALKAREMVHRIIEDNKSLWVKANGVEVNRPGKAKRLTKKAVRTAADSVEQAVPMPAQIVHHLNLRVYKKERAISFDIEGFSIKIGFIE